MDEEPVYYLARSTDPQDPVEMRLPFAAPPLRFVPPDIDQALADEDALDRAWRRDERSISDE